MKIKVKERKKPVIEYPCLVIYKFPYGNHQDDGLVVYKVYAEDGVVVYSPEGCCKLFGYRTDAWITIGFSKFKGTVELSND
jgi:hypothetical protein